MKVITRCVMEWDGEKYVVTEEDSYDYEGPVALCGSSSGGTNTVQQNSDPWDLQQQYLHQIFQQGQGQFYQGPYQGPRIGMVNPLTKEAQNAQVDRARDGSPLTDAAQQQTLGTTQGQYLNANPAMGMFQNAAGTGGQFNDIYGSAMANPANAMYGSVYSGAGNSPVASGYQSLIGGAQNNPSNQAYGQLASGQNENQGLLSQTARGDFIGANPYLQAQFKQGAEGIKEQLAPVSGHMEAFGSAPRELSERALTNLATNLYGGAYNTERANQLGAQQSLIGSQLQGAQGLSGNYGMGMNAQLGGLSGLGGDYRAGVGQQLGAAGGLGGVYQGGLNTQLGATQGLLGSQLNAAQGVGGLYDSERSRQLQATGMAPGLANQDYFDIAQLGNVGAQREARRQAELQAAQQAHQSGWDNLFNYQKAVMGGGAFGGQTQTQQPFYQNPYANALGMGLGGMAMYGMGRNAGLWGGGGGTPVAMNMGYGNVGDFGNFQPYG